MSNRIHISKKLILIILFISLGIGIIYAFNFLLITPVTVRTNAKIISAPPAIKYGEKAEDNGFPYFTLVSSSDGGCGGSLISEEWVLTAAHCVRGKNAKDIFVIIGLNHIDSKLNAQFTSGIREIIMRDDYIDSGYLEEFEFTITNDIALLRLIKKAKDIPILSIPDPTMDRNGDGKVDSDDYPENVYAKLGKPMNYGTILGFGMTEKSLTSNNLLKGSVYIQDYERKPVDKIKLMPTRKAISCYGDSGGPFIMALNNRPQVIGISKASPKSGLNFCVDYSFYTSITHYSEWIKKITEKQDEKNFEGKAGIQYESGVSYNPFGPSGLYPNQTSQSSFCRETFDKSECLRKSAVCYWYLCGLSSKCAPLNISNVEACRQ